MVDKMRRVPALLINLIGSAACSARGDSLGNTNSIRGRPQKCGVTCEMDLLTTNDNQTYTVSASPEVVMTSLNESVNAYKKGVYELDVQGSTAFLRGIGHRGRRGIPLIIHTESASGNRSLVTTRYGSHVSIILPLVFALAFNTYIAFNWFFDEHGSPLVWAIPVVTLAVIGLVWWGVRFDAKRLKLLVEDVIRKIEQRAASEAKSRSTK